MTDTNQYAERDPMELDRDGNYYCRHVSAMTAEGLHKKSDIAAELAWRDREIDRLRALSARASAGEGGEWVLVPREPTPEMGMAAGKAVHPATYWQTAYRAMIAAAPQPAQAGASGGSDSETIDCVRGQYGCGGPYSKTECLGCSQWRAANPKHDEPVGTVHLYPATNGYAESLGVSWNNQWNQIPPIGTKLYTTPASPATGEEWRPMETAPRDGTMVRLLVEFTEHATEDSHDPSPTIGANNDDNVGEGEGVGWQFAGWCWTHDHFTQGEGTPVGWLPMVATPQPAAAQGGCDHLHEARAHVSNAMDDLDDEHRAMPQLREAAYHLGMLAAAPQPQYPAKFDRNGSETTDAADVLTPPAHGDGEGDYAAKWFAECRRVLEDVSTEMRATGRGDTRFRRLIESMPRQRTTRPTPEAQEARDALNAIYDDFASKDNGDVPLESYPQGAVNALARAGWAVVPCDLPFAVLGDAAQAGVFETGNPKYGWDYLVSRTRIGPANAALALPAQGEGEV